MSIFSFIMACNFDRPAPEIACELIYRSTNYEYKLLPRAVVFGIPRVLDPRPDIEDDPNSYVPSKVDPSFDYRLVKNASGFLYTRLPLAAMPVLPNTIIQPLTIPFTAHQILDQINAQLGTRLTEEDIEDTEYITMDDDFVLTAKKDSLLWVGWRFLQVLGGGKKFLLFPNYLLNEFKTSAGIQVDKRAQLAAEANLVNSNTWKEIIDYDFDFIQGGIVGAGGRNTRIYIKAHRHDYIDQWLYYKRLPVESINDPYASTVIPKVTVFREVFTTYQILREINTTLNLNLDEEDVFNDAYEPGPTQIPIRFRPTSLGWLPGTYMLNVKYPVGLRLRLSGPNQYRSLSGDVARIYG